MLIWLFVVRRGIPGRKIIISDVTSRQKPVRYRSAVIAAVIVYATTQTVIAKWNVLLRGRSVRMFTTRVRSLMPRCRQWSQRTRSTTSLIKWHCAFIFLLISARETGPVNKRYNIPRGHSKLFLNPKWTGWVRKITLSSNFGVVNRVTCCSYH